MDTLITALPRNGGPLMILDGIGRWRRKLDLDGIRPKGGVIDEQVDRVFEILDDGQSNKPITDLIRCILLQALVDRALAVHVFHDDDDKMLRMQYCLAVPPEAKQAPLTPSCITNDGRRPEYARGLELIEPDPLDPRYERVWYEMVPPPPQIRERFFRRLRWHAGMKAQSVEGVLRVRFRGNDLQLTVTAPWPDDFRIYCGPQRPPIRPKLARHYAELGRATPP